MFVILGGQAGPFAFPIATDEEEIVQTESRERFEHLLDRANAALVVCPLASDDPGFFAWLTQLIQRHAAVPFIAVLPPESRKARALGQEVTVAWLTEGPEHLLKELRRVAKPNPAGFMAQVANAARRAPAPLPQVARVLEGEPISRVEDLLAKLGFSRSYLYAAWRESCPAVKPKQFVDVVLLTRALILATRGQTHFEIAEALGVDESTLNRISRRLTGRLLARNVSPEGLKEALSMLGGFVKRIPDKAAGKENARRKSAQGP
jgi:hypothetical protein